MHTINVYIYIYIYICITYVHGRIGGRHETGQDDARWDGIGWMDRRMGGGRMGAHAQASRRARAEGRAHLAFLNCGASARMPAVEPATDSSGPLLNAAGYGRTDRRIDLQRR